MRWGELEWTGHVVGEILDDFSLGSNAPVWLYTRAERLTPEIQSGGRMWRAPRPAEEHPL